MYQITSGGHDGWFSDDYFDLFLWRSRGRIDRFQLSYDKSGDERILTWSASGGYSHDKVDNSRVGGYPATPILLSDGVFEFRAVARAFRERSAEIDGDVAAFVLEKVLQYGSIDPSQGQ
jgi:hypothetical protein